MATKKHEFLGIKSVFLSIVKNIQ